MCSPVFAFATVKDLVLIMNLVEAKSSVRADLATVTDAYVKLNILSTVY